MIGANDVTNRVRPADSVRLLAAALTALLAAARKRGNPTVNGLGMLLHQARPAFHAWFGIMPEVTPELRAMIAERTRPCASITLS